MTFTIYHELVHIHYGNKYKRKFKNLLQFLTNEKKLQWLRLNKCFFTIASAAIIFSKYRNKNKDLIGIEDTGFNKYFEQKNKNFTEWTNLEPYGISHEDHPLEDRNSIDLSVCKKALICFWKKSNLMIIRFKTLNFSMIKYFINIWNIINNFNFLSI